MGGLVVVIFYGSIIFCIAASAVKLYLYARYPVHLRWEIYKARSVYEASDWWEKKGISPGVKLGNIFSSVVTLKEYFKNNRPFWLALYPFHLGIYLLVLWHAWLFMYPLIFQGEWPVGYSLIWGHTATGLIFAGALGVLIMRIANPALKASYPRRNYFKWIMILLAAGTGYIAVEYYFNGVMADVLSYVRGELQFNMAEKLNPPLMTSLHVLTVSAVLVYIPFSHALRLFFRYYHELRWNYVSGLRNKNVFIKTKAALDYPIAWVSKHTVAGRTWKDLA